STPSGKETASTWRSAVPFRAPGAIDGPGGASDNRGMASLFLFGGGPRPAAALAAFAGAAGGQAGARVLVVAWASREPLTASASLDRDLRAHGVGKVETDLAPPAAP